MVYALAPSHLDVNVLWAGTDDGLIHVTRDGGKSWKDITPRGMTAWSKVAQLDSSQFDDRRCMPPLMVLRLDDMRPHAYRTHDGGATWTEIVHGLAADAPVNAVREDPVRKGLLYAATELAVYVSFNDGDDWQPLRLNMPHTSVRDIVVHGDDLAAATHGRGFWILDDIAPLRQLTAETAGCGAPVAPSPAIRWPRDTNTDTPLPPEEPAGKNPPDGAILYYYLRDAAAGPVTIEIVDASGKSVRTYSSTDKPAPIPPALNMPTYWIKPATVVSSAAGMHRLVWELHGAPPPAGLEEGAVDCGDSPRYAADRRGMLPAGNYTVKLTVAGQTQQQPLVVKPDPRQ